jgi:hypothetical protein
MVTDHHMFHDDYIHLAHNAGVFLHDDLLAVLFICNSRCLLSTCASAYFLTRSFACWLLACLQAFLSSIPASVVASSSFSYYS